MDSVVRDSKVNPIGDLEAEEEANMEEKVRRDGDEKESLLVVGDGRVCKEEVKPKTKRTVQWNDTNGNKLAEILEFFPSDVSESDDDESEPCFCTIM